MRETMGTVTQSGKEENTIMVCVCCIHFVHVCTTYNSVCVLAENPTFGKRLCYSTSTMALLAQCT